MSSSNEEIMVACCQKDCEDTEQSSEKVSKVRETVYQTRNCQTRPKLSMSVEFDGDLSNNNQINVYSAVVYCKAVHSGHLNECGPVPANS